MSTISKELRTTAIFKCIVTLKNGFHKTLRMQVNKVAQLVAALRQLKQMPWLNNRYESLFREYDIDTGRSQAAGSSTNVRARSF